MKKLVLNFMILSIGLIGITSCEKEPLSAETDAPPIESEVDQTRVQGGVECFRMTIVYRDHIDCTKEGTTCKVECSTSASGDAALISFLSGLDPSVDNTVSLQAFLEDLTYIPSTIQNDVQSATTLGFISTQNNGTTAYAILDSNGDVLYAFSFNV